MARSQRTPSTPSLVMHLPPHLALQLGWEPNSLNSRARRPSYWYVFLPRLPRPPVFSTPGRDLTRDLVSVSAAALPSPNPNSCDGLWRPRFFGGRGQPPLTMVQAPAACKLLRNRLLYSTRRCSKATYQGHSTHRIRLRMLKVCPGVHQQELRRA